MKPLPIRGANVGRTDSTVITAGNPPPRRQIRSAELFNGGREVLIEHAGELYSLRQTSKGKLILTK
jgi:hemin uptake protein HemP